MARGVFGMSVITALTAQNTKGVQGVHEVPADFIATQLDSVLGDIGAQVPCELACCLLLEIISRHSNACRHCTLKYQRASALVNTYTVSFKTACTLYPSQP